MSPLMNAAAQAAVSIRRRTGWSEYQTARLVARAVARRRSLDAGMGSPALIPGTTLLATSSFLSALGWLVYLAKG